MKSILSTLSLLTLAFAQPVDKVSREAEDVKSFLIPFSATAAKPSTLAVPLPLSNGNGISAISKRSTTIYMYSGNGNNEFPMHSPFHSIFKPFLSM
jgi:hypothetical protein